MLQSKVRNLFSVALLIALGASVDIVSAQQAKQPEAKAKAKAKAQQRRVNPVYAPIKDDPALPRVLLLGDSISIGYTLPVRKALEGKANVHRAPTNCGPTTRGLENLDAWLGDGKWDVIHFNFGLHDLKYQDETGKNTSPDKGKQQVPLDAYEQNIKQIVERLKKTGATLIWCNTTPVPAGEPQRVKGDAVKYNEVATKIARENGVSVNDLYTFALERLKKIQRPANVHFTPEGSQELGEEVARQIEAALKK